MADLPPNHHAEYRQFSGVFGYIAGLTMIAGRRHDARLVAELAGIGEHDHVLDIGCGPGTAVRHAAATAASVTGLDPAEPMLKLARALTRLRRPQGPIEWVCAGAEKMSLADGSVSVCWSLASVHHWPDLEGALAEVRRVLRPGSPFIALEKRTQPGASGNAGHGWTAQQAERFAAMLTEGGWDGAEVAFHDSGRRKVITVLGRA